MWSNSSLSASATATARYGNCNHNSLQTLIWIHHHLWLITQNESLLVKLYQSYKVSYLNLRLKMIHVTSIMQM